VWISDKWLQSIDARYLAFLTDQLLDYVRSTSLHLHVLRFSALAAGQVTKCRGLPFCFVLACSLPPLFRLQALCWHLLFDLVGQRAASRTAASSSYGEWPHSLLPLPKWVWRLVGLDYSLEVGH
jgi:hypothetical protein